MSAFTEGTVYRVYYVAHVNYSIILSFEIDEADDADPRHTLSVHVTVHDAAPRGLTH